MYWVCGIRSADTQTQYTQRRSPRVLICERSEQPPPPARASERSESIGLMCIYKGENATFAESSDSPARAGTRSENSGCVSVRVSVASGALFLRGERQGRQLQ